MKVEARSISVNSSPRQASRPFLKLAVVALALWGLYTWWAFARVQSTGELLRGALQEGWPASGAPQLGVRDTVMATADELAAGRVWTFGDALEPVAPPTDDERRAATEFFAKHSELRIRFLNAADAARELGIDGKELTGIRQALARAYRGAARNDERTLAVQLDLAERGLALISSGAGEGSGPADEQTVANLVSSIDPAYRFSQDLMTEGGAAAEKVLIVAARDYSKQQYVEAASAVYLAGALLGVQGTISTEATMPEWFSDLAEREIPAAIEQRATATVELAEAMALSITPSDTIDALLKKARRELNAQRNDTAAWWASVTLNAMGMSDAAIAAANVGTPEEPAEESAGTEGAE